MKHSEKVKYDSTEYRKEREKDIIRLFDAYYQGINREDQCDFYQLLTL